MSDESSRVPPSARVRIADLGVFLPGERVPLLSFPLVPDELARLTALGQEYTYLSAVDSTELMVLAAHEVLQKSGVEPHKLQMIISAPSLITSYGLEIPAIAVKTRVDATHAQCLNIAQGCVGVLRAIHLASLLLRANPDGGDILVVTSCRASSLTHNMNHGAFFWGDAGGAILLTTRPGSGFEVCEYAEANSHHNWGAMRVDVGDACQSGASEVREEKIYVSFDTTEERIQYIRGEKERFGSVIGQLLTGMGVDETDIYSLHIPSTGKNRITGLLTKHRKLFKKIKTDFRCGHLGGVDSVLSLLQDWEREIPPHCALVILASPAFTAQWAGLLLKYRS